LLEAPPGDDFIIGKMSTPVWTVVADVLDSVVTGIMSTPVGGVLVDLVVTGIMSAPVGGILVVLDEVEVEVEDD
jgi:hypothetical protein